MHIKKRDYLEEQIRVLKERIDYIRRNPKNASINYVGQAHIHLLEELQNSLTYLPFNLCILSHHYSNVLKSADDFAKKHK